MLRAFFVLSLLAISSIAAAQGMTLAALSADNAPASEFEFSK